MKKILLVLFFVILAGCAHARPQSGEVFQNAPISALMAGCYDGTMSVKELKDHGDFGLGTLDALDGEMVALDGNFYQIKPDGKAYLLKDRAQSPFAVLTVFDPQQRFDLDPGADLEGLKEFLDGKIALPNLIYAVRVDGKFKSLKVRSASAQKKPYPVLTEAIRDQKFFELSEREGTLVGFRFPPYMGGLNVPGYHFHFLSKDRTEGGHVLGLVVRDATASVDETKKFSFELPSDEAFLNAELGADLSKDVEKVEK